MRCAVASSALAAKTPRPIHLLARGDVNKPGDFQFINNRTILHGRAHFEDHEAKDQRRHLYRLWLNVPEWPRMPVEIGVSAKNPLAS